MPSPTCTVNATATTNGVNVAASSAVTIALADTTGVTSWSLSIFGTDETHSAPALTVNQTNKTATFTAPTAGAALLFKSIVNNGVDVNGTAQPSYTTTFGIFVLTAASRRVVALGQTTEGDASFGWVKDINTIIRNYT